MPCYRSISYVQMSVCRKGAEAAIRLVLFGMCVLMTYPTLHYKEIRLVIPSKINLFVWNLVPHSLDLADFITPCRGVARSKYVGWTDMASASL